MAPQGGFRSRDRGLRVRLDGRGEASMKDNAIASRRVRGFSETHRRQSDQASFDLPQSDLDGLCEITLIEACQWKRAETEVRRPGHFAACGSGQRSAKDRRPLEHNRRDDRVKRKARRSFQSCKIKLTTSTSALSQPSHQEQRYDNDQY